MEFGVRFKPRILLLSISDDLILEVGAQLDGPATLVSLARSCRTLLLLFASEVDDACCQAIEKVRAPSRSKDGPAGCH